MSFKCFNYPHLKLQFPTHLIENPSNSRSSTGNSSVFGGTRRWLRNVKHPWKASGQPALFQGKWPYQISLSSFVGFRSGEPVISETLKFSLGFQSSSCQTACQTAACAWSCSKRAKHHKMRRDDFRAWKKQYKQDVSDIPDWRAWLKELIIAGK